MFYEVGISVSNTSQSFTTAMLLLVFAQLSTLDVTHMRNGYHHFFIGDQIFDIEFTCTEFDVGATCIAVFIFDFSDFRFDDFHAQVFRSQYTFVVLNFFQNGIVFLADFIDF